jgi:hypothetical protein
LEGRLCEQPPCLEKRARDGGGAAMNAAFDARPVYHSTVCCVLRRDLALQNAAVLQCKVKDVALGGIGHGIEPYSCRFPSRGVQTVSDASKASVSPMQPAHAAKRLGL